MSFKVVGIAVTVYFVVLGAKCWVGILADSASENRLVSYMLMLVCAAYGVNTKRPPIKSVLKVDILNVLGMKSLWLLSDTSYCSNKPTGTKMLQAVDLT